MDTISLADGSAPKYLRLLTGLRSAVAEGRLAPGDRLPPVRELAWQLGVTPGTVARGYRMAIDEGLLTAAQGSGTYVARPATPDRSGPSFDPVPPGGMNLRTAGVPDVGQAADIAAAMTRIPGGVAGPEGAYLGYPGSTGDEQLSAALAAWFSGEDHGEIAAGDAVPTLGGQQALLIALSALLHGSKPVVLSEDLTYHGVRAACRLLRADLRGLPMDADGILPEALDRVAAETGAQVLMTSACVHSPTTRMTSRTRRAEIVEIVRRHGMVLVDDDCFGVAELIGPSYRALAPDITWVTGTLSKTVSPELRVGAIISPPGQGRRMRVTAQQHFYGMPRPQSALVAELLSSGAAAGIRDRIRVETAARVAIARRILGRYEPEVRDQVPFCWLPLGRGWRPSTFVRALESRGVRLRAADEFAAGGAAAPSAVRATFNAVPTRETLTSALASVASLLETPPSEDGA